MSNDPVLLIDADIFLHEATTLCEFPVDYGNDNWVLSGNLEHAKDIFNTQINSVKASLSSKTLVMCLSDRENFRKDLNPEYKSHRKATRKPMIYPMMRDWIKESFMVAQYPKLEADDTMGILATKPQASTDPHRIIVSTDKDMQCVPGFLWRQGELMEITEAEADLNWLTQTLTGDPTDGYKGCPSCGPIGAKKALNGKADYGAVELQFMKAGLTKQDALMNARMARILRWEDWNTQSQQVILWEPKTLK